MSKRDMMGYLFNKPLADGDNLYKTKKRLNYASIILKWLLNNSIDHKQMIVDSDTDWNNLDNFSVYHFSSLEGPHAPIEKQLGNNTGIVVCTSAGVGDHFQMAFTGEGAGFRTLHSEWFYIGQGIPANVDVSKLVDQETLGSILSNYYTKKQIDQIKNDLIDTISNQYVTTSVFNNYKKEVSNEDADLNNSVINNASGISSNLTNISILAGNDSLHASLIANNTSNINSNTSNIQSNTNSINSNTSNIQSNTNSINSNTSNIQSNTSNINSNTSNIQSNTNSINSNTSNIQSNTNSINSNTSNIQSNTNSINSLSASTSTNGTYSQYDLNIQSNNISGVNSAYENPVVFNDINHQPLAINSVKELASLNNKNINTMANYIQTNLYMGSSSTSSNTSGAYDPTETLFAVSSSNLISNIETSQFAFYNQDTFYFPTDIITSTSPQNFSLGNNGDYPDNYSNKFIQSDQTKYTMMYTPTYAKIHIYCVPNPNPYGAINPIGFMSPLPKAKKSILNLIHQVNTSSLTDLKKYQQSINITKQLPGVISYWNTQNPKGATIIKSNIPLTLARFYTPVEGNYIRYSPEPLKSYVANNSNMISSLQENAIATKGGYKYQKAPLYLYSQSGSSTINSYQVDTNDNLLLQDGSPIKNNCYIGSVYANTVSVKTLADEVSSLKSEVNSLKG